MLNGTKQLIPDLQLLAASGARRAPLEVEMDIAL